MRSVSFLLCIAFGFMSFLFPHIIFSFHGVVSWSPVFSAELGHRHDAVSDFLTRYRAVCINYFQLLVRVTTCHRFRLISELHIAIFETES